MTPLPVAEQSPVLAAEGQAVTRIPRTAHARRLLHDPALDPPFMERLQEVLPDEAARLAYLNHIAWEGRS